MEFDSMVIDRSPDPANLCGLWVGADAGPWRSSSVVPGDSNNAYDLNGDNGDIDNDNRSDNNDDNAVRCVRPR